MSFFGRVWEEGFKMDQRETVALCSPPPSQTHMAMSCRDWTGNSPRLHVPMEEEILKLGASYFPASFPCSPRNLQVAG